MVVLSVFAFTLLARAEGSNPMKALAAEKRESITQDNEFKKAHMPQAMELTNKIKQLELGLQTASDNFARTRIQRELDPLKKKWREWGLQMARHEVESARKTVELDQRYLQIMEQKLSDLEDQERD